MSFMLRLRIFVRLFLIYVIGIVNMYYMFLQDAVMMQGSNGIVDVEV